MGGALLLFYIDIMYKHVTSLGRVNKGDVSDKM